jgi:serine/threonine-protein kinase
MKAHEKLSLDSPREDTSRYHGSVTLAIDDCRVIQLLAQGATSQTVLLENGGGTAVGVGKRLVPRLRADPVARLQFDAEARVLEVLGGRGAPNLLARGEDGEGPWLVMEYLAMQALAPRSSLERDCPAIVTRIAGPSLLALATVHEAHDARGPLEVVHGDVSPGNILLDDLSGEARLVDFGLAHFRDRPPARFHGFRGTARYAAPEVARGEPATRQSDLFSLGLTLLQVASGELPRAGWHPAQMIVEAGEASVTPYAQRAARALPPSLRGALLAMVSFDPADRPGSARDALARWGITEQGGEPEARGTAAKMPQWPR